MWMKTIVSEEQGYSRGFRNDIIQREFRERKPIILIVLMEVYKSFKVLLYHSIDLLYLSIGFQIK